MNYSRKIFTDEKLDITFIEIKRKKDKMKDFHFINIDDKIDSKEKNLNAIYKNKSIYIVHYPKGENVAVSFGLLSEIQKDDILHSCNTSGGSSGSPILNLNSLKVIGIHYGYYNENEYNVGTFIKSAINEFYKSENVELKNENEINNNEKANSEKKKEKNKFDKKKYNDKKDIYLKKKISNMTNNENKGLIKDIDIKMIPNASRNSINNYRKLNKDCNISNGHLIDDLNIKNKNNYIDTNNFNSTLDNNRNSLYFNYIKGLGICRNENVLGFNNDKFNNYSYLNNLNNKQIKLLNNLIKNSPMKNNIKSSKEKKVLINLNNKVSRSSDKYGYRNK